MQLHSQSFDPYDRIDPKFAFGTHDPDTHFKFAGNRNPELHWSAPPAGTKSLVLLCVDEDVPSVGDDVNQEGRSVPVELARVSFFHWVLIDLPPTLRQIAAAAHSDGVTVRGKAPGPSPSGGLQGINDYTGWFAGNPEMSGDYAGYDGCGPPWNDARLHGYRFQIYALDTPSLGLSGAFTGSQVRDAIQGHILARGELIGLYAINPSV